ncbi:hypothetical protein M0804_003959 [Polistes exclamans]|nr:hypothetical protein M0804_003959 [Polistes exclamans]
MRRELEPQRRPQERPLCRSSKSKAQQRVLVASERVNEPQTNKPDDETIGKRVSRTSTIRSELSLYRGSDCKCNVVRFYIAAVTAAAAAADRQSADGQITSSVSMQEVFIKARKFTFEGRQNGKITVLLSRGGRREAAAADAAADADVADALESS